MIWLNIIVSLTPLLGENASILATPHDTQPTSLCEQPSTSSKNPIENDKSRGLDDLIIVN